MCVDDHGQQHEFSVPAPLMRRDLVAEMRADAEALLPPQFLDCLHHIGQPFFTPVYDFCSPSLVFGRVVLMGDATSTPRPHIGFGVSKASAEAQALARALSLTTTTSTRPLPLTTPGGSRSASASLCMAASWARSSAWTSRRMKIAGCRNCCKLQRAFWTGSRCRIFWRRSLTADPKTLDSRAGG